MSAQGDHVHHHLVGLSGQAVATTCGPMMVMSQAFPVLDLSASLAMGEGEVILDTVEILN